MTGHTTVGVNDDLAASQTAVSDRAADHEVAGRVDMVLGAGVQQLGGQYVLDDFFQHGFAQIALADFRVVLGRQHDGVNRDRLAVVVAQGDLALGVRAEPGQYAVFAQVGLTLHQAVRVKQRCGHQHIGFVSGVTEHQALVASALIFGLGTVNALINVDRLFADGVEHGTAGAVKTDVRAVVANTADYVADDVFQIHIAGGGDFTGYDGHAGFYQRLHRHAGVFVAGDNGIEYRVGNLIRHFVGVAFRNGL